MGGGGGCLNSEHPPRERRSDINSHSPCGELLTYLFGLKRIQVFEIKINYLWKQPGFIN